MADTRSVEQEIAERIRAAIDPGRVVLFGSRARSDAEINSDYDILIVSPSPLPRWKQTARLYSVLAGMGVPKDIIWWTPGEIAEWRNVRSHFITRVMREGKIIYERPA